MKPTAAAKAVAAEWQVSESTVFKDYARHLVRLVAAAEKQSRELKIEIGRLLLRDHPRTAAKISDMCRDALASAGANSLHASRFSGDEWLIVLGEFHMKLLSSSREPTTEADGLYKALAAFITRFGVQPEDVQLNVLH